MASANAKVAQIFDEIADLLELQDANAFRVRAYRYAAQSIGEFGTDIRDYVGRGLPLTDIPGIGADLEKKIKEILDSGSCEFLLKLEEQVPAGITRLLRVPGLGPKRVRTLWHDLDIVSAEQLLEAAKRQRIRTLPGFGEKTERKILEAVERYLAQTAPRFRLAEAERVAEPLAAMLRSVPGVNAVEITGSYRRRRETVGDLDLVATASTSDAVMERFIAYPPAVEILSQGPTRASVRLNSGIQVDLRVLPPESFGAACQYFTGSKAHNIAVRRIAQDLGLKINEYGVFRGETAIAGKTEASVYAAIGLPWIPPELREDRGEIQAAREGKLPALIELKDLRGDLHILDGEVHDAKSTESLLQAAAALKYRYAAITLPARVLRADPGSLDRLLNQIDRANAVDASLDCLSGIEVDVLEDGSLGLPDVVLDRVELVVAAVHDRFDLTTARQTERVLKALSHPRVSILAHPTNRLLGGREAVDIDMQQVTRKARERDVALEVNGQPERLDLTDTLCRLAVDENVALALSAGAQRREELAFIRYAIGQARRGWVTKADIINTLPLARLRKRLAAHR